MNEHMIILKQAPDAVSLPVHLYRNSDLDLAFLYWWRREFLMLRILLKTERWIQTGAFLVIMYCSFGLFVLNTKFPTVVSIVVG